ncbi:MAG: secondary thiamine-phosphate synthase enzyme YjbQ [Elusimicrobia bacterium]|jgi:secondary thiamine-phosphate synthase enzyme|nr:secondary thiamine-phosphate synthase enzyme YjbQ [Elusimicrobiota bacterium]
MIKTEVIKLDTCGNCDIINITPYIENFIQNNGIREGLINISVKGSTGAVTSIEYEPNLIKDFKESMEILAPSDKKYQHAKTWNDDNGYSHVRASVVGFSESVPVTGGELILGTWQQVVVIDFDTAPRKREVALNGIYQQ